MSPEWNLVRARLRRALHLLELGKEPDASRSEPLEARARHLADLTERAWRDEGTDAGETLDFAIGERTFSVETRYVVGVTHPSALVPLPMPPPFFVGLAGVRGEIVPVIDLLAFLDTAPDAAQFPVGTRWLIVLGQDSPELAFAADRVGVVAPLEPSPTAQIASVLVETVANGGRLIRGDLLLADARLFG